MHIDGAVSVDRQFLGAGATPHALIRRRRLRSEPMTASSQLPDPLGPLRNERLAQLMPVSRGRRNFARLRRRTRVAMGVKISCGGALGSRTPY